jgi:hypothetical protein
VIIETDLHFAKDGDPTIAIFLDFTIYDDPKTFRIDLLSTPSINNLFSMTKIRFLDSIKIDDRVTPKNAEPSANSIFHGIVTDLAVDFENGFDSIQFVSRVNLIQM